MVFLKLPNIAFIALTLNVTVLFAQDNFLLQRERMVKTQIIHRGIKDQSVLDALMSVPRHEFVPTLLKSKAYKDTPLPIGYDQTISQPYIVGLMTELLELEGTEKVLEIGTGSGYQAAILSLLSKHVYTIEIIEPLADQARKKLSSLGYTNIDVKWGDGFLGWPEKAPFDAIIVTCAPKEIPPKLIEQLIEGGKLVIPVGDHFQSLKVVTKNDGIITIKDIIPVRFVPMVGGDK